MKYLIFTLCTVYCLNLFADVTDNRFEAELKYLEREALTTDEVKISNSAIQKEELTTEQKEIKKDETEENIFFKTPDIKPRRIRSR